MAKVIDKTLTSVSAHPQFYSQMVEAAEKGVDEERILLVFLEKACRATRRQK